MCNYLQLNYITTVNRVLDLGAAYCDFINNISANEKHALDVSDIIQDYANKDVHTHIQSCVDLSIFKNDFFNVVFASNIFEHLTPDDLTQSLIEIKRVLVRGGKLIVLQPNFRYCYKTYFDDYTHTNVYTHHSLSDILEIAGFKILDVKPKFLPVNLKSSLRLKLPRLDLIVRLYLASPFKPRAAQMLIVVEN